MHLRPREEVLTRVIERIRRVSHTLTRSQEASLRHVEWQGREIVSPTCVSVDTRRRSATPSMANMDLLPVGILVSIVAVESSDKILKGSPQAPCEERY